MLLLCIVRITWCLVLGAGANTPLTLSVCQLELIYVAASSQQPLTTTPPSTVFSYVSLNQYSDTIWYEHIIHNIFGGRASAKKKQITTTFRRSTQTTIRLDLFCCAVFFFIRFVHSFGYCDKLWSFHMFSFWV